MTPEERKMLSEALSLAKDNNQLLKKIRRNGMWGNIWRIAYWVIILGLSFGAYYFIQPYVDQFGDIYSGFKGDVNTVQKTTNNLVDLLKKIGQ